MVLERLDAVRWTSKPIRATGALFAFLTIFGLYRTSWTSGRPGGVVTGKASHSSCGNAPQDHVAVVIKTGASEVDEKLPTLLNTTLSCVENLLIVSDLDADFHGYHMHDVLANVSPAVKDSHPAFEIYRQQIRLRDAGATLQQLSSTARDQRDSHKAAWELDKFKFLHMINTIHHEMPGKDWYVFIEADTYLVWPNLMTWLGQLDARQKLHIGSPSFMAGTKFNHGGSGFVLSGPVVRAFATEHPGMAQQWDERMSKECCGDYVLALALTEIGIPVSGAWPMLSGEQPIFTPYGPAVWCQPVITMHHVDSNVVDAMWAFEQQFASQQRPLLFQDLYEHFLPQGLPSSRSEWDNRCPGSVFDIRDPLPEEAKTSNEACSQACDAMPHCMQALYKEGECKLYKCFTLGKYSRGTDPSDVDRTSWHSTWKMDRIREWVASHDSCTAAWTPHSTDNARSGGI
ncbi:hypothetical protein LTR95_005467 [Oleoguttula sp. CCFEE 5521]